MKIAIQDRISPERLVTLIEGKTPSKFHNASNVIDTDYALAISFMSYLRQLVYTAISMNIHDDRAQIAKKAMLTKLLVPPFFMLAIFSFLTIIMYLVTGTLTYALLLLSLPMTTLWLMFNGWEFDRDELNRCRVFYHGRMRMFCDNNDHYSGTDYGFIRGCLANGAIRYRLSQMLYANFNESSGDVQSRLVNEIFPHVYVILDFMESGMLAAERAEEDANEFR